MLNGGQLRRLSIARPVSARASGKRRVGIYATVRTKSYIATSTRKHAIPNQRRDVLSGWDLLAVWEAYALQLAVHTEN